MKVIFFSNTDWYLYNFRLSFAKFLRNHGIEVIFISSFGNYGKYLQKEGFQWIPIPMIRRSLNPFREISVLNKIIKIYKQEQPDLVHHFTIKSVVYGSLAARIAGISRRINAITGLGHIFTDTGLRSRLLRPIVRILFRIALKGNKSRLILQNPDDVLIFRKANLVDFNHICLIRSSGVDTFRFRPSPHTKENSHVTVLLATRLLREKGVFEYIDAARHILNTNMHIKFLIAGETDPGNPSVIPIEQISRWRNEGKVIFLGHIENMEDLLKKTDIVVLPSYREGVPKILLEAAACGLPLIATDVPGCREIVDHNINGILIPAKNPEELVKAIIYMYSNYNTRIKMGEASRKKVLNEFDEQIIFQQTFSVYQSLLNI